MTNSATQIKVTNHNDTAIEDMYDGCLYRIPANGSVNFNLDAAKHIFGVDFSNFGEGEAPEGIRQRIFSHLQKRWGWNRAIFEKDVTKQKPEDIFDQMDFTLVTQTITETLVETPGLAAPRPKKQQKKLTLNSSEDAA